MDDAKMLVELQRMNDSQAYLTENIDRLSEEVKSLNKTVRGSNGTPGIVTSVAIIQQNMLSMSGDIAELKKCVVELEKNGVAERVEKKSDGKEEKPKENGNILTKAWLSDKLLYLAMAFLVWFLLDILPNILSHIGD